MPVHLENLDYLKLKWLVFKLCFQLIFALPFPEKLTCMVLLRLKKIWFKITHWESWHYQVKYIPIAPVWLWYCLKARSFWFFTASNPTITFGGFEGEGKMEIYKQLPENSYPESVLISHDTPFEKILELIDKEKFSYPLVVKPDIAAGGYLFRRITSDEQLKKYHSYTDVDYIIQKWVDYPFEISLFYYRMPDSHKGVISGLLLKEQPGVTGDGKSTLSELISNHEILRLNYDTICSRHRERMEDVLPAGKSFILSHASNRSQGARLQNLNHEIDEQLCAIFDQISLHSKDFFYGRYDIKCSSIAELKEGKNFSILEYNGAGAGIQHVYGNHHSLFRACKMIVQHWEKLFRISAYNHRVKRISYWEFTKGRKFLKQSRLELKKLKMMDEKFPV